MAASNNLLNINGTLSAHAQSSRLFPGKTICAHRLSFSTLSFFSHCLLPFSYHESCSAVQPLNQYLGTEAIESSNDILGRQSREGH